MGRKKNDEAGKRITIYLLESQLKTLDERAEKAKMTRSKYIEFCCGLQSKIANKIGNYGKGESKCKTE